MGQFWEKSDLKRTSVSFAKFKEQLFFLHTVLEQYFLKHALGKVSAEERRLGTMGSGKRSSGFFVAGLLRAFCFEAIQGLSGLEWPSGGSRELTGAEERVPSPGSTTLPRCERP